MASVPVTPAFGDSRSVQNAVEREMRRRRILIGVFLVLLGVPIVAAVLVLSSRSTATGPTARTVEPPSAELKQQVTTNDAKLAEQQQQIRALDEKLASRDQTIGTLQQQAEETKTVAQDALLEALQAPKPV